MRGPNRIDAFCGELATYWHKVPDWRFGQFVSNVLAKGDFFYKEDDDFLNDMKEFFDRKENKTDITPVLGKTRNTKQTIDNRSYMMRTDVTAAI